MTGLTGMLWGGLVRVFLLHHVTYSINSLCHFFGRRRFETDDESRNLLWLSPLSFGESWHNNHHAFPTSFRHGMKPWELDISAGVIWLLEKAGPRLGRGADPARAPGAQGGRTRDAVAASRAVYRPPVPRKLRGPNADRRTEACGQMPRAEAEAAVGVVALADRFEPLEVAPVVGAPPAAQLRVDVVLVRA